MLMRPRRALPRDLHVEVTGSGEVRIRFPGGPTGGSWVEQTIEHEVTPAINEDVWRLYETYECSREGDTFTRLRGGLPICVAGQWECAIFEHGEADFVGGMHGDEVVSAVGLTVDGTTRALNAAWSGCAHRADFQHLSTLYRVGTGTAIADRGMSIRFGRDGFTVTQRVKWRAALSLDFVYLSMLPVVRHIGTAQITHTAKRSPSYVAEDVSTAGFIEIISHTANVVRVYGDDIWTQIECSHREQLDDGTYNLPLAMGVGRWEKVANVTEYNKVYLCQMGGGAALPESVASGDVVWTTTHYQIRTDGGP